MEKQLKINKRRVAINGRGVKYKHTIFYLRSLSRMSWCAFSKKKEKKLVAGMEASITDSKLIDVGPEYCSVFKCLQNCGSVLL